MLRRAEAWRLRLLVLAAVVTLESAAEITIMWRSGRCVL